jgi:hypothetical protein
MPEFQITIESAAAVPFAAVPLMAFALRIHNEPTAETVHTAVLKAQIQIEATRRPYRSEEQVNLGDLFGSTDRWGQTLRSMLWTHATVVVPPFAGTATVQLHLPCTFDFNVAATKYFYSLESGDIPLCFQFSGTIFYRGEDGTLQVAPISWNTEARYRLAVQTWKDLMEQHYPNSAWLMLQRDVFDRLYQYKVREGIPTWEQALERALSAVQETVRS